MHQPTRIAFISEHASPLALLGSVDAGGQNVYVDEVTRSLARRGYLVDIFTRRDTSDQAEIVEWAPGVRVVHIEAGPSRFLLKDEIWPYMPIFRDEMLRFMERQEITYSLLHGNFWMSGWVAVELGEHLGIPAVQIFHATGKTKRLHQGAIDTSPEERIDIETQVIRRCDRVIAQCPEEWDELVHNYDADPHKVVVIPSAVNTEVFHPVEQLEARQTIGIEREARVIAYIGRMLPRKDIRNLVRATAELLRRRPEIVDPSLAPLQLLLVGGETTEPDPVVTPEIGELQKLGQELEISQYLTFVGKRQPKDLCQYYSAADMVVTTPWYEPFGLTPLEAMACGRPVIGSAVGGIKFTIKDRETGLLVPPRDPASLAEALYSLLTQREVRENMGISARQRVEQEFTWPVAAMRTATLYRHLLDERSSIDRPAIVDTILGD